MGEVEAGLSRGGMGLKGLVEGEAGVEHRGHRGQAPLASGGGPLPAFLEPTHGRPSRAAGLTAPALIPFPPLTIIPPWSASGSARPKT